jgi:hypothetical protein
MEGESTQRDHVPRHSPLLAGAAFLLLLVGEVGYGEARRDLALPAWSPVALWLLFCIVSAHVIATWWQQDSAVRRRPLHWAVRTGADGPLCA